MNKCHFSVSFLLIVKYRFLNCCWSGSLPVWANVNCKAYLKYQKEKGIKKKIIQKNAATKTLMSGGYKSSYIRKISPAKSCSFA